MMVEWPLKPFDSQLVVSRELHEKALQDTRRWLIVGGVLFLLYWGIVFLFKPAGTYGGPMQWVDWVILVISVGGVGWFVKLYGPLNKITAFLLIGLVKSGRIPDGDKYFGNLVTAVRNLVLLALTLVSYFMLHPRIIRFRTTVYFSNYQFWIISFNILLILIAGTFLFLFWKYARPLIQPLLGHLTKRVSTIASNLTHIKCPACDAQNEGDATFCNSCGANLDKRPVPQSNPICICSQCSTKNEPSAIYCSKCGTKLNPAPADENPSGLSASPLLLQPKEPTVLQTSIPAAVSVIENTAAADGPMIDSYYYLDISNEPVGPYTLKGLINLQLIGRINGATLVAANGDQEWKTWKTVNRAKVMVTSEEKGGVLFTAETRDAVQPIDLIESGQNQNLTPPRIVDSTLSVLSAIDDNGKFVKFSCPHCNQHVEAPKEILGTTVDCPSCSKRFQLTSSPHLELGKPLPANRLNAESAAPRQGGNPPPELVVRWAIVQVRDFKREFIPPPTYGPQPVFIPKPTAPLVPMDFTIIKEGMERLGPEEINRRLNEKRNNRKIGFAVGLGVVAVVFTLMVLNVLEKPETRTMDEILPRLVAAALFWSASISVGRYKLKTMIFNNLTANQARQIRSDVVKECAEKQKVAHGWSGEFTTQGGSIISEIPSGMLTNEALSNYLKDCECYDSSHQSYYRKGYREGRTDFR